MVVSWVTACEVKTPTVKYGTKATSLTSAATATSTSYTFGSYASPHIHHAVLTNLTLNKLYFYSVGGTESGYSATLNFTSHPGTGADVPFVFSIIGDLGTTSNSVGTLDHVLANPLIQACIYAGDVCYADNSKNWSLWDALGNQIQPSAAAIPWMMSAGNHDIENYYGNPKFLEYSHRYRMPNVDGQPSLYYSFDIGPAHWIMLSTYSDYGDGSPQTAWLKADLLAVNRSATPWVFVVMHAPWYNTNKAHNGEAEPLRLVWEDIFLAFGVDAVFAGHVHGECAGSQSCMELRRLREGVAATLVLHAVELQRMIGCSTLIL